MISTLRNNGRCLHLPRRDPHHAQASFCKYLAINPNFAGWALRRNVDRFAGATRVA